MNSVNLIGRLTKDPDTRYTDQQLCIARFTLAVDRYSKDKNKQADFIPCVAFGKSGELIEKYVKKGEMLGVTGSIQTGSYTDKDGKKVYTTNVAVERLKLMGSKNSKQETREEDAPEGFEALDEELPF